MHVLTFFFFNDTATTEIYTLSLHDALPISSRRSAWPCASPRVSRPAPDGPAFTGCALLLGTRQRRPEAAAAVRPGPDRKSTRLNSSHANISYAVFCLKKKTNLNTQTILNTI